MPGGLTETQLEAVSSIERACSAVSLVGSIFVIVTFCMSRSFHKPVNRLVFYASFGNMLTNVGTLMSRTYTRSPNSVGCQFQAFLIQMFMPADAFWTLAMAINVYLTFYYRFDAQRLRRMEIPYMVVCYGVPLIPALVYIFLGAREGNRVYGDATLWCWVTTEWNILRIVTFYAPVWILILATMFIYVRAGRTIYYKHKQLHEFSPSSSDPVSVAHAETMTNLKTTEITVSSTEAGHPDILPSQSTSSLGPEVASRGYTVAVATGGPQSHIQSGVTPSQPSKTTTPSGAIVGSARRRNHEVNTASWAYTKCAILFFTALLITWLPSSANRVYSFVHPRTLPTLEIMSAFVLPLQGFWNAVIYVVTSRTACKNLWSDFRQARRPRVAELVAGARDENFHEDQAISMSRSPRGVKGNTDSESTREFATCDNNSR